MDHFWSSSLILVTQVTRVTIVYTSHTSHKSHTRMTVRKIDSVLFKGRQPLAEEDLRRLTVRGGSGAFREMVRDHGLDPDREMFIGTLVMVGAGGVITGCQPVKCGKVPGATLKISDVWEESPHQGNVIVADHDASLYTDINGQLTSQWTNEIPWKVKLKIDGKWQGVKKGKLVETGLSELCFRMNTQIVSADGVKVTVSIVPESMELLTARGDAGGRFFPGIKVSGMRGKLFPVEEAHHKFGVGIQPLMYADKAGVTEYDDTDFSGVVWPTSQAVKDEAARLLQTSTMPNVHMDSVKWREAVTKGNYVRRSSPSLWPAPRREEEDTEPEDNFVDTSGECGGVSVRLEQVGRGD